MNLIGQRIKELRESSHLSQADISKICGISQATIAKTEAGKTAPSVRLLLALADHFDISMDYLTCRTDQPQGKLYECKPCRTDQPQGKLYECKPRLNVSGKDMKQFIEMCFDPQSPYNTQLKETLLQMMEESKE